MLRNLYHKKELYDGDTKRLIQTFNRFIDEYLAAMLAAEELGGPLVGTLLDINEQNLEAGFSVQRKARKMMNEAKRQRRIYEIWVRGERCCQREEGKRGGMRKRLRPRRCVI